MNLNGKIIELNYLLFYFQSISHSYGGHSSHVTNVTFLQDDTRLVSTGGGDTSVLQWVVN